MQIVRNVIGINQSGRLRKKKRIIFLKNVSDIYLWYTGLVNVRKKLEMLHLEFCYILESFFRISRYTEKSILNLVESNQILIAITLFRLIWQQMKFRLVPNQSGKCNYDQNLV